MECSTTELRQRKELSAKLPQPEQFRKRQALEYSVPILTNSGWAALFCAMNNSGSNTEKRKRERMQRQADELRANLKRRKLQARARTAANDAADASDEAMSPEKPED